MKYEINLLSCLIWGCAALGRGVTWGECKHNCLSGALTPAYFSWAMLAFPKIRQECSFYFKHICIFRKAIPIETNLDQHLYLQIIVSWSEFVLLRHRPIIPPDSKYGFLSDLHMTAPFPRKDQSFLESQSGSHVFGKQRITPCVDKLCHIITPNVVSLRKQKLWTEARGPQHQNLRPAHVFLHTRDCRLWKGLLTGKNKSLSLCGSLFNIQDEGSNGSTGGSGSHLFVAQQRCSVETHNIFVIWNSEAVVLQSCRPLSPGRGRSPDGPCKAMWNEQLAVLIKLGEDSKQPGEKDIFGKNNS